MVNKSKNVHNNKSSDFVDIGSTTNFSKLPLNGVSYKKLRSMGRAGDIQFNNGEPINIAAKKIAAQLFFIIFVIVLIFSALIGREFIIDKLTDNGYSSLSIDSKYKEPISVSGLDNVTMKYSAGYAVIESISKWSGSPVSEETLYTSNGKKNIADYSDGMTKALENALKSYKFSVKRQLSNYDLLSEIHDSLAENKPVIVSLALKSDLFDDNSVEMSYAIVSGVDFGNEKITIVTPYGRTDTIDIDDFLAATRFSSIKKMSLPVKIGFTLEIFTKNNAFFIS